MTQLDFFVSYSRPDEEWAAWIGWELEDNGFDVTLMAWDFRPGANFVQHMHSATSSARRTIAVLSPDYLSSNFTQPEWQSSFAADPLGIQGLLLPVRVSPCNVGGLLGQIVYVDFVDHDESACRELLLRAARDERNKPDRPPVFPANQERRPLAPSFPGRCARDVIHPRLAEARDELSELAVAGATEEQLADKRQKILNIRRELREGGRLRPRDELLSRYVLIEILGDGGFATVWKAFDQRHSKHVAVKVLHPMHAADQTRLERFYRGAREMAKLDSHPHIVRVLEERGEDGGFHFFVMEYIEGGDLQQAVNRGPIPFSTAIDWIQQIGSALSYAHSHRVIHRDVKPANVLVTRARLVCLTDFDLARAHETTGGTRTGPLGTFIFAAPEAMKSAKSVDEPGDVFSLGMTAIFLLGGKELDIGDFQDPSKTVDALPVTTNLKRVLKTCVSWDLKHRYQTVESFLADLNSSLSAPELAREAAATSHIVAPKPTVKERPRGTRCTNAAAWRPRPSDGELALGATVADGGVDFSVYSKSATAMRVLLYDSVGDLEPYEVVELDASHNRTGDIWRVHVDGLVAGQLYHLQAAGDWRPEQGHIFSSDARLIDPCAQALAGTFLDSQDGVVRPPKCVVIDHDFDWTGDTKPQHSLADSVVYEMHVGGFTKSQSSGVQHPGTFLGVKEKIDYLKSLGVTAVELMPIQEFPILSVNGKQLERPNYWGYDPLLFSGPHRGYAAGNMPGCQVDECKEMIKALHQAGIEVILDIVFNHTAEGGAQGPTLSFKGLENPVYYMLEENGARYKNFSGCGNSISANHPVVAEMIVRCLRQWVHHYHVDGFRFDLASALGRDPSGTLLSNPPLLEAISQDPLIADKKLIAEAWDAAGAYQVGSFGTERDRWAEWNGRYRDDIRDFWRGTSMSLGALATRITGSSDLYEHGGRPPSRSINFVTSHDGFTLNDLVSYNQKHNDANGEDNLDGDSHNISDNCGVEGPTTDQNVNEVRQRQIKNMLCTLLLSQGVPMLLSGDEVRRTQQGNNNAHCQDNEISWFDWQLVQQNEGLLRFVRELIKFRRSQPTVRQLEYLTGAGQTGRNVHDVSWFNVKGGKVDWGNDQLTLTAFLAAPLAETGLQQALDIIFMFNARSTPVEFQLPESCKPSQPALFVDTAADSPDDVTPENRECWTEKWVGLEARSLKVFVGTPPA